MSTSAEKLLTRSEPYCEEANMPKNSFAEQMAAIVIMAILIVVVWVAIANTQEVPLTVRIAESQIGRGEIGGNNQGPIVEMYTRGQNVAWCAGFVSWVRSQAGDKGPYLLSARSYWTSGHFKRVSRPKPGDFIIFYRGSHSGHVGIVEKVQGARITTIEGNVGRYPAKVKRFRYTLGHIRKILGFVRVR